MKLPPEIQFHQDIRLLISRPQRSRRVASRAYGTVGGQERHRLSEWDLGPISNRAVVSDISMCGEFACRLHRFESLARDFEESARSGFSALLSRPPTHDLA